MGNSEQNIATILNHNMPKGDRNCINPFAMAVVKVETVVYVDHVPKNISSVCCLYSLHSESIVCHAMGPRHYCKEIPCVVIFDGSTQHTEKVQLR